MTAPRQVLPGRTYLITRRCTQRQFLLRPDRKTNRIFLYCLAVAAERYGVRVIAWLAMSNHYHAVVHDAEGRLPAFLEHFHKLVAKALNARWGRWENLWSTEQAAATYLVTPEDVFEKVVYTLCNPVVGYLVDRVTDWPGGSSFLYLGGTRELTVQRPIEFFRTNGKMPKEVTLRADVPAGIDRQEWAVRVREAISTRERAVRGERHKRRIQIIGRKAVLRSSAFEQPKTREPRRTLSPAIACRDRQRRTGELRALRVFRQQYAAARKRITAGARNVIFPAGAYRWPLLRVVACQRAVLDSRGGVTCQRRRRDRVITPTDSAVAPSRAVHLAPT